MIHLREIKDKKGQEFIDNLLNQYVIVAEKLDGMRFSLQKDENGNIQYFKRDGKNPISKIDRTLMKVFEDAINHIESLDEKILDKIPDDYHFGFEYFYDKKPVNITYDRLPKNKLVLTDIQVREFAQKPKKIIDDPKILIEWANDLNVEEPPVLFQGKLNKQQKTQINEFLNTPINKLEEYFSTNSFVRYILSILNPDLKRTALMEDLDKPIEGVVFKFMDTKDDTDFMAKIVDPIFTKIVKEKKNIENNYEDIINFHHIFIDWFKTIDLQKYKLKSNNNEDLYIELISLLFLDFINDKNKELNKIEFQTDNFLEKDEFSINLNNIDNKEVKNLIQSNPQNYHIFRLLLSTFRKIRKRATAQISKEIISPINDIITKINSYIMENINENKSYKLLNFNQWKNNYINNVYEEQLFEAFELTETNPGKQKVNFIVGRFQPPTLGHFKVIEQIYKQNRLPVLILTVRAKKRDPEKLPFDDSTIEAMFQTLQSQYPKIIAGYCEINTAAIDIIINKMRPDFEPVLWGTGSDRLKGYGAQIKRYTDYPGFPDIKMYEIKRTDKHISASKVRQAIRDDDIMKFKEMVDPCLHSFYSELKKQIK